MEDMMIQYVPDSVTDVPPTSISFQQAYSVRGQVTTEYFPGGNWDWGFILDIDSDSAQYIEDNPPQYLYVSTVSASFSTNVLTSVVSQNLGTHFKLNVGSLSETLFFEDPAWLTTNVYGDGYIVAYAQPNSYNASLYFIDYSNIVDQNNQPVPRNKLIFSCVDTNNAGVPVGVMSGSNSQAVSLQAIPATNSVTLQWPLYATDYQLQLTPDLANVPWTTNALPPPVQVGPFLQVNLPTTNASTFFRLLKTD